MRPSSTRRVTLSSAMVVPKALCRLCASMHAMVSALLLFVLRFCRAPCAAFHLCWGFEPEPQHGGLDAGPFFRQEFLTLALQEQISSARLDVEAEPPLLFDEVFVHQLLVAFENGEWIDSIF